jgi:hypothetical protein
MSAGPKTSRSAPINEQFNTRAVSDRSSICWDGGTRNGPTNPSQNKPALSCTLARATSTVFRASLNSLILPFSATRRAKKS